MNAYGRKGHVRKETVPTHTHKQKRRKKERTDHKCLWQRKKEQTTNVDGK